MTSESGELRSAGRSFEIERVNFSLGDRRILLAQHRREEWAYLDDENETPVAVTPFCVKCGEMWGAEGCRTVRAVTLVAIHERNLAKNARRISELTEAIAPRFGVERLRDRGNRTTMIRMQIDEHSLVYAGLDAVDACLAQIRRHFRKWFKDVGDLSRIQADHAFALTLDSSRYVYLTQEFDAFAPFIKPPDVPWENSPVPLPEHPSVDTLPSPNK